MSELVIYINQEDQVEVELTYDQNTFWLSLSQISNLFGRDKSVISRHIKNIFKEGELDESSTVAKNATVQKEGDRLVERQVEFYNLDLIIAVGYRVNSKKGTEFRIWATQRLRDYLVQGYAINEKRLAQKQQEVQTLKDGIRILSRAISDKAGGEGLEWLNYFAKGLELLDDYDHEQLDSKGLSKQPAVYPEGEDYQTVIASMRNEFGSGVFGKEKDGGFLSAVAQIRQGFGKEEFYPTLEEKAATLLYLIVKNHAFVDGNKRIAAACFLLFLKVNRILHDKSGNSIISNEALASLTLFIAASKAEEMETVKKLVISVLNRNQ